MLQESCCSWFDGLTMRFDSLKTLDHILSLSKDGAKITVFSAARYSFKYPT